MKYFDSVEIMEEGYTFQDIRDLIVDNAKSKKEARDIWNTLCKEFFNDFIASDF